MTDDVVLREDVAGKIAPYIQWNQPDLRKMELARDVADYIIRRVRESIYNDQHHTDNPDPLCYGDDPCICEQLKMARKEERRWWFDAITTAMETRDED
jgi:hypothetical protein